MMNREQKIKRVFNGTLYDKVIDMESWLYNQEKLSNKTTMNIKGTFNVIEINDDGYIVLEKTNIHYKILISSHLKSCFKIGDQIKCNLYKNPRFIYWDMCKIKKLNLIE